MEHLTNDENVRYLNKSEVVSLNYFLLKKYSPDEILGVKSDDLLESAINRPRQSVVGIEAYPDIYFKSAALFESLLKNHPFHCGNKRTAFCSLVLFLSYNNINFNMPTEEAVKFTIGVIESKYDFVQICNIIASFCDKKTGGINNE